MKQKNRLQLFLQQVNIYNNEEIYEKLSDAKTSLSDAYTELSDIKEDYIKMIHNHINMGNNKLKVVYDCGNGTTSIVADDIFNRFSDKLDLIPLFNTSDSTFPNHHPDPAVEENLSILKTKVKEIGADVGVAFDGDGDRIGVIDSEGNSMTGDKLLLIYATDLIESLKIHGERPTVVSEVKCSQVLYDTIDEWVSHLDV